MSINTSTLPILKLGSKNKTVGILQDLLNKKINSKLIVDNDFGTNTKKAVINFQKANNLVGDGIVGQNTWKSLYKEEESAIIKPPEPAILPISGLDPRSIKTLSTLDQKARKIFEQFTKEAKIIAGNMGYEYTAINGHRTWEQQNNLYNQPWDGKDNNGNGLIDEKSETVTKAKGGYSNHNFGIATDFGVFKDNGKIYVDGSKSSEAAKVHKEIANKIAAKYGLEWGGNWKSFVDNPHFEIRTGLTLAQKRALYQKNGSVL